MRAGCGGRVAGTLSWAASLLVLQIAMSPRLQASQMFKVYERAAHKPVAEILEDAEFAISERNFRITGRLHVGRGIRERDGTDFPDYEVLLFCNLGYARQMLELDPTFIIHCPGRVSVRGGSDMAFIAALLLPEPDETESPLAVLVRKINADLRAIVDYGAETWDRTEP
jgi:uncharacterized protein (DUF302 family)